MDQIGVAIVGVICIILGITNFKGNVSTLHKYHRNRVTEEDRPIFGRLVGIGTIIIGVAFLLAAAVSYLGWSLAGTVILIIGLILGLGISFYAMIKYNKGIF